VFRALLAEATLLLCASVSAQSIYRDSFDSPELDRWEVTFENDFKERRVEVSGDHRLRIRADTMGTRDDTVKFVGARLRRGIEIEDGVCIATTLDWNQSLNGSYLSGALVLAGEETTANPLELDDWLAVEYVGVPPGRNARMQIRTSEAGRTRTLEDEGWPHEQRTGRRIDTVRIVLELSPSNLRLWENGELVHEGEREAPLSHFFLHLQLSSHSNYRAREVYFDDIEIVGGRCDRP
jgi:hypothetical protein